jgi:signal transduction histidine kinase
MFNPPSNRSPMPSFAANIDGLDAPAERIVDAVSFLARRSACGMAWLDSELRVSEQFGAMIENLRRGVVVTSAIDALSGLDEEIVALRTRPERALIIPNILAANARSREERITFTVYWMPEQMQYLLLMTRASSFADIEYRLAAEVRGRAIAEAEVAAQARIVSRVNEELAAANRDLQEFASVISHDLRAPLRGVRYAAKDAKDALETGNGAAALGYVEHALSQARRMNSMLTGLLEYAQAGRKSDALASVDTGALVAEIADSMRDGGEHEIIVEGEWPTIETLAEPLDIVLRNLIDNAVKHHDRNDGRIVVHAARSTDRLMISVADDGPGIDPQWHEAIFLPFKQVADSHEADGAGIGLAMVKKTIERFGGEIEVQSDPSVRRGATFRIGWPLTLPA